MRIHTHYLKTRRFDPEYVIEKYDLYFGNTVGNYRHCIIIPVFSDGQAVCFIAADCTRKRFKYKNSPKSINVLSHSEVFYNLSNQNPIIIVEGIFDSWRIDGIALMTKKISAMQLKRIINRDVFIFLDPDAIEDANKLASMIFWCEPKIIISDKEPDDFESKEHFLKKLKKY